MDTLVTLIYSAIKYTILLREVKQYEAQKHIRDLKDKFFASRIKNIHSEMRNPFMLLGGSSLGVETFIENNELTNSEISFLKKQVNYFKQGAANIFDSIEALDIASDEFMTIQALMKKIKILLNADIIKNKVEIIENLPNTYSIIDLQEGYIPFVISKVLIELISIGNKNIELKCEITDNIVKLIIKPELKECDMSGEIYSLFEICKNVELYKDFELYIIELKVQ